MYLSVPSASHTTVVTGNVRVCIFSVPINHPVNTGNVRVYIFSVPISHYVCISLACPSASTYVYLSRAHQPVRVYIFSVPIRQYVCVSLACPSASHTTVNTANA